MIIPWLMGIRDFGKAPLTWMLFFLNSALFLITTSIDPRGPSPATDRRFMQQTGAYYLDFQRGPSTPSTEPAAISAATELPSSAAVGLPSSVELFLYGGKALRDPAFLAAVESHPFRGDPSILKDWRVQFLEVKERMDRKVSSRFGVQRRGAAHESQPLSWITYQFIHADFFHLAGNMDFLLIFGAAIEALKGPSVLLATYVLGGFAGAWFSGWMDAPSALPMVGASASISALIGLYLVAEFRKRISYLYFFSPFQGYYGEVFLSKWWLIPLCLVSDVANWLMDQWSFSGGALLPSAVASSAHLGGIFLGVLGGLILRRQIFPDPLKNSALK